MDSTVEEITAAEGLGATIFAVFGDLRPIWVHVLSSQPRPTAHLTGWDFAACVSSATEANNYDRPDQQALLGVFTGCTPESSPL
jgi:hypothetical protein